MSQYFEKIRSSLGRIGSPPTDQNESAASLYRLPSLHFSPMVNQRDQRWWEDVSTYRSYADRTPASPSSEQEDVELSEQVMGNQDLEEGRDTSYDALNPNKSDNEEEADPDIVSALCITLYSGSLMRRKRWAGRMKTIP